MQFSNVNQTKNTKLQDNKIQFLYFHSPSIQRFPCISSKNWAKGNTGIFDTNIPPYLKRFDEVSRFYHVKRKPALISVFYIQLHSWIGSSFSTDEAKRTKPSRGAFRTSPLRRAWYVRIVAFWAHLTLVDTVNGLAVSVKFTSLIHKSKSLCLCLSRLLVN